MPEHDDFDDFDDFSEPLADLSPEVLADYLTQLQANLDRAEHKNDTLRLRIGKLEDDRETLRSRLDEARLAAQRRGLDRFRSASPTSKPSTSLGNEVPNESQKHVNGRLDLKVATILDPISTAVFDPEFDSIPLGRNSWREQLSTHKPDILFVESAFSGIRNEWAFRVAHFGAPHPDLVALTTAARRLSIPTVFWNKEDPINYGMFLGTASLFDHVFTVDASTIARYQADLRHERVCVLPFAAQPALHFAPLNEGNRRGSVAFAGSYYAKKHSVRRSQMDYVLGPALDFGLDIYDRMDLPDDPRFTWPERFRSNIVGSIPYAEMGAAYRRYKVFLNVNTVVNSPTMCARRVFELAACGTPIVSGPSLAIDKLVPESVAFIANDENEASSHIRRILDDPAVRTEAATEGPSWIQQGNTYEDRVATILDALG